MVVGGQVLEPLAAVGAQSGAVGAAQGLEGQRGHQGVAQCRFEVQGGLPHRQEVLCLLISFGPLGLDDLGEEVELVDPHAAVLIEVAQAAHALAVDVQVGVGLRQDAVVHGGQGDVEGEVAALGHADDLGAQVGGSGGADLQVLDRAGGTGQIDDIDDES